MYGKFEFMQTQFSEYCIYMFIVAAASTNTTEIKVEATNEKKSDELQLLKLSYAIILGIDVVYGYGVEALLFAIAVYFGAKLELMLLLEIAIAFHRATPLWVAPKMDESFFLEG